MFRIALALLSVWLSDAFGCSECASKELKCALNGPCRNAFECIGLKCGRPCAGSASACNVSQCMVNDGKCGPSPKCTLRCFDTTVQYSNPEFNDLLACMVKNKCLAQMHGDWPDGNMCNQSPLQAAAVPKFNLSTMEGRWFITRGLSDEFDIYPCQVACNRRVAKDRVNLSIWYQIPLDNGTMLPQVSNQSFFNPDPSTPAHLRQHAWMDGQDDWYVIAAKPDKYWLVKYCGTSDTWDGYGGGFLYTRTPTMDPSFEPELRKAAARAGFKWDDMQVTQNHNCGIEATPQYGCPATGEFSEGMVHPLVV